MLGIGAEPATGVSGAGCHNPSVAHNRRQQRRQGVVYGPPRGFDQQSNGGAFIGRLVGLGVVVLALGLLAIGAVAFVGAGGSPTVAPARSELAGASPTASLPPAATSLPTAAPTVVTTTAPSSFALPTAVSSFVPQVNVGPGYITFGTRSDSQLHIVDPQVTFSPGQRIVWSAFLVDVANSVDLRIHILKFDPASGTELLVSDEEVTPVVQGSQLFLRRFRPENALQGPGIYAVRYVRGIQVMSEGHFEIRE